MNTGAREWDAETYDAVSDPQFNWGMEVLERLELRGDEAVLDAGCGSGRVTAELLERLPDGPRDRRRRLRGDGREGARAARRPRRLPGRRPGRAGAGPSRSTWSSRPRPSTGSPTTTRSSAACARRCKPGGRLVAQCGGAGQRRRRTRRRSPRSPREPEFAPALRASAAGLWNFAGAGGDRGAAARGRLRRGPLLAAAEAGPARAARSSSLAPSPSARSSPSCRRSSAARSPKPSSRARPQPLMLDYVRLNIEAVAANAALPTLECRRVSDAPRIVVLPGDGIGPEIVAAARAAAGRARRVRVRRAPDGRLLDRRPRHRPHRRGARRLPRRRRGPARRRRRPQVGHHRPRRAAPRAGPARPAQGDGPLRQPAPGPAQPGPGRRQPAARGADRRHRPAGRPRADRRHLLRRPAAATATSPTTPASTRSRRSSGSPAPPSRPPAAAPRAPAASPGSPRSTRPTCWRPRGSGARWSAASPPTTPTSSSTTCWSTTRRCSWSRARPTST